jgi:hypothetical protein
MQCRFAVVAELGDAIELDGMSLVARNRRIDRPTAGLDVIGAARTLPQC